MQSVIIFLLKFFLSFFNECERKCRETNPSVPCFKWLLRKKYLTNSYLEKQINQKKNRIKLQFVYRKLLLKKIKKAK